MATNNVKGVTYSIRATKNYHPAVQFTLHGFLASSHCFGFPATTSLLWFTVTALISLISSHSRQLRDSDKPTVHYLSSQMTNRQKVASNW